MALDQSSWIVPVQVAVLVGIEQIKDLAQVLRQIGCIFLITFKQFQEARDVFFFDHQTARTFVDRFVHSVIRWIQFEALQNHLERLNVHRAVRSGLLRKGVSQFGLVDSLVIENKRKEVIDKRFSYNEQHNRHVKQNKVYIGLPF